MRERNEGAEPKTPEMERFGTENALVAMVTINTESIQYLKNNKNPRGAARFSVWTI